MRSSLHSRQRERTVTQVKVNDDAPFDRVYRWKNNPTRLHFHGRLCRILAKGTSMRSVLIEFEDGERLITSSRAVKRVKK